MASIAFNELSVSSFKKELQAEYPDIKSSHLSEAIGAALGYNTYAALRARLTELHPLAPPCYFFLKEELFGQRLAELGYPSLAVKSFDRLATESSAVRCTVPKSAHGITYSTAREKAWRNLMVLGTNAALKNGVLTLAPDGNLWPDAIKTKENHFQPKPFALSFGIPGIGFARCTLSDAGFHEVSIHVYLYSSATARDNSYDVSQAIVPIATAQSWLERQVGVYLQSSLTQFYCKRDTQSLLAQLQVDPLGYGDRGKVIM